MPIHQQWRLTSPLASTRLVNKLLLHVCCVDSFFLKLLAIRNKPENFFFFFLNKGRPLQAIKNCKRNKKKNVIKWKKKEEERLPAGNKRRVKTISYTSISSFSHAGLSTLVAAQQQQPLLCRLHLCARILVGILFFSFIYIKMDVLFPFCLRRKKKKRDGSCHILHTFTRRLTTEYLQLVLLSSLSPFSLSYTAGRKE